MNTRTCLLGIALAVIAPVQAGAATFWYLVRVEQGRVVQTLGAFSSQSECLSALSGQKIRAGLECRVEGTPPRSNITGRPTPTPTPKPTPRATPVATPTPECARRYNPFDCWPHVLVAEHRVLGHRVLGAFPDKPSCERSLWGLLEWARRNQMNLRCERTVPGT